MADGFFGNALEFLIGCVLFSVVNGIGGLLLVYIVPSITGSVNQGQLISQIIIANYVLHIAVAALFVWWKKILGVGYALSAVLNFLFHTAPLSLVLSLLF